MSAADCSGNKSWPGSQDPQSLKYRFTTYEKYINSRALYQVAVARRRRQRHDAGEKLRHDAQSCIMKLVVNLLLCRQATRSQTFESNIIL